MHPAKPGRRLGRVSGRTLLADRLRDELLDEITSSQLQPGTKLPTEGELAKRFERISGHGAGRGAWRWSRPATSPVVAVRAVMSPSVGACRTDSTRH